MADYVSRRTFLAAAGSLAAGRGVAAPSDRTTIGMIAVGARAHQLIESIQAAPDTEIVSVFDAYQGRVQRAIDRTGGRASAVADYHEILDDDSIDAVFIASPDHWHATQTLEALAAGKHVYCEKPLTYTVEEGLAIAAAAEKSDKVLQVGSQGISTETAKRAKQLIQAGKLGRVTMIRANYNRNSASGAWIYPIPPDASEKTVDWNTFLGPAPERPFDLERFFRWRCYEEYSGGIATDLFVHLCTTIHELMGVVAPSEVVAVGDLYRWSKTRDVPDTLNAILRYPQGFTVTLSSTFNNGSGGSGFEFLGTEGSLALGGRSFTYQRESQREVTKWITDSWPRELQEQYEAAHRQPRRRNEPEEFKEHGPSDNDLHVRAFFNSVRQGRSVVEDVWAGHHAAACAHMVNRSARQGRTVHWDPEKRLIQSS